MTALSDLAQRLASAQRTGRHDVDPGPYAALTEADAYGIQTNVMEMLGETPGMLKTAITPGGPAVAPIFRSRVGNSGVLKLDGSNLLGFEVEVAVVLGRDVPTALDDAAILAAIDHYVVGIEIVGSRFTDRSAAGPFGAIADNMASLGYAIDPTPRALRDNIEGIDVALEYGGVEIYRAPAKHGFGTVLASFLAYARAQHPTYPLKAGMIVTTGSMCGLVPATGTGRVMARFGVHVVEMEIV